ncbi:transglutaminase family protein [Luteolibacter pohnpeiensis]|uniref:Transglutaminase family protein n=1 Tax=Luteolibacter pohnpeiensis TaxID=454153 RepID=A0A934S2M9_9BACT|nr:transglutaminase family protein [Luteolibacter pohnpeiensis]MBK1882055.1 transglutaminase family protein [Luteolibacter pohnpeiensis]
MSIHVALHHRTSYQYDRPVEHGPHVVRLRPAPHCRSRILSYSLKVGPMEHFVNWQQDPQSNYLARLMFPEPTDRLDIEVNLVVEMSVQNPFDFFLEPKAEEYPFSYDPVIKRELEPFLVLEEPGPLLAKWINTYQNRKQRTVDFLVEINAALQQAIDYRIRMEPGVQTPEETLEKLSGSCRDSAWLLVQLLRHLGLAARFVSGYLIQLKADVESLDGPSGSEVDFTDLHAWAEVYLPGAGWIGLDATSGLLAGEGHLPLACSPEPMSAAPVTGGTAPCKSTMDHEMHITRIYESPRTTLPYRDEQWAGIMETGDQIDADLRDMDVRLTMGGEPTFISMDDFDGEEWNNAAMGPTKRVLSDKLIKRLRERFAPGGLLFYGQGKWYPGEQLPRWSLACYWRKDGQPIWEDVSLIADESRDYGYGEQDAQRFGKALAEALDTDAKWLIPAYEDAFYYLWREKRLPRNVDPVKSNLKDKQERDRLARVFEQGLDEPVGWVMPLQKQPTPAGKVWASGPWFLPDDTMYLLPGDSPVGYRLPLSSLPWVKESEYPYSIPQDPTAPLGALPPHGGAQVIQQSQVGLQDQKMDPNAESVHGSLHLDKSAIPPVAGGDGTELPWEKEPTDQESAAWLIRRAICFEARHGRLHVFMPPLDTTEDFLELVALIEQTAANLQMSVILEGTPPSFDPRLEVVKVTPDPGVIEVNLQPAASWSDLVRNTTVLYEEARQCRLATEKFMIDGRHCGTGGGNHIIIGGETPSDSPLLRRPDLLRSMVTFWNHHPSLSFLFSGLFVGPTSQAPRIDEARNDSIHELEIAFQTLGEDLTPPPWKIDRALRNLLIDSTGNTHRAEFCIDKLYSPDSATGRLGLLEMRNFEMPPHHRMSLAQHLVLRGLVARFWKEPYEKPLVRWGSEIHDRWMLPHFIWQDFKEVLDDLSAHGYQTDHDWFAPHLEFRFPKIGDYQQLGIDLEIRHAIEPWHVLGEDGTPGGTVRYVDSSVERMQVLARGLTGERHVITCNGTKIPLRPTGTHGEYVAGIRYRAWQPPNCLHPTIAPHTPLVLDILDTWNDRSIGGCTYHAAHPGGRNHTSFPVNAYEAEARRLARFFRHGHTGGKIIAKQAPTSPDFPFTLDLRMIPTSL